MPDFTMTPEIRELRGTVRAFMDEHVYPNEPFFMDEHSEAGKRQDLMKDLQARTRSMGMWAPHLPAEAGGMGIGFMNWVFCSGVPNWCRISALPESGACAPKASGAIGLRPRISFM